MMMTKASQKKEEEVRKDRWKERRKEGRKSLPLFKDTLSIGLHLGKICSFHVLPSKVKFT